MAGADPGGGDEALLSRCLNQFFVDQFHDWKDANPERMQVVTAEATAIEQVRSERGLTWDDAARLFLSDDYSNVRSGWLDALGKAEVSTYLLTEESRGAVMRLAFAHMSREEAPRHADFQQFMQLESFGNQPDCEEIGRLATALAPWCAEGGRYGCLFDGVGNIDLSLPVVYFELGQIPDSMPELKAMAGLVIANQVKGEIMGRPRSERKRVVFEEFGSFLHIRGGGQIAQGFYEKMRKFNCWVTAVFQQISAIYASAAFASIVSNTRLGLFLRQSNPDEVEALGEVFQLPASARESLLRFPEPSKEMGAAFLACINQGAAPLITTGYNVAHPEMLYLGASGGDLFDRRQAELTGSQSVVDAVIANAQS